MRRMCIASYATGTPDPSLVSRQERLPQLHTRLELVARARIKRAFHAADQIQFCRVDTKTFRIEQRLVADILSGLSARLARNWPPSFRATCWPICAPCKLPSSSPTI